MSYTVLARRYRSQTFDDVIGQEAIAQTLKNAIKSGRVAHAYLFTGTRGVGKTTMARILAKAMNCLKSDGPTTQPCCECESCVAINAGDDIDVIEIDGASNRGIENIRELRQNAIYRPARGRHKIYIIDEVHMLTTEAFNALLKILEEPPAHVKFIFATTEPNKVLATIQSRCQRFDFTSIGAVKIAGQLKTVLGQEKIGFEDDLVVSVARLANGSMRDALSLLDQLISTGTQPLTEALLEQFLGRPSSDKLCRLVEKIGDNDAAGSLGAIDELLNSGQSAVGIVNMLVDYMRDMMVIKAAKGGGSEFLLLTSQEHKTASQLAEKFDIAGLIYGITALERLRWVIKNTENPRPLLEASILRLTLSEHFMNVDALLGQLNEGQTPDIKKKTVRLETKSESPTESASAEKESHKKSIFESGESVNSESIKIKWSAIADAVGRKTGGSIGAGLVSAAPLSFENGLLRIEFPSSAAMAKNICESNSNGEKIRAAMIDCLGMPVRVEFLLEPKAAETGRFRPPGAKASKKELESATNDPAVRTVMTGLNAMIINVDQKENGQ